MINIWCYWSQGIDNIPHFHRQCLKNWNNKISNKYKINVIDKDKFLNMQNELKEDFFSFFTYQQQSDMVRIYLLYNYGGIWIDITTILMRDLDWIIEKYNEGYNQVGNYIQFDIDNDTKDVMENSFIAVEEPYDYKIGKWKETFYRILREAKEEGEKQTEIDLNDKLDLIPLSNTWSETDKEYLAMPYEGTKYLSQHVAHLWCLQNDKEYNRLYNTKVYLLHQRNAFPFMYCSPGRHVIEEIFSMILGESCYNNAPIMKFTGQHVKLIEWFCPKEIKNIVKKELNIDYVAYKGQKLFLLMIIYIFFARKIITKFIYQK